MAVTRHAILTAIAAETAERNGPMPAWLVGVAVNAKDGARKTVDAELVVMRAEGLIDYHRDAGTLALTDAGRQALRDSRRANPAQAAPKPKPQPKPNTDTQPRRPAVSAVDQSPAIPEKVRQVAAKPLTRQGSKVAQPAPAPAPAPPPPPPAPPAPPADPERVDPERQPELATLLCDLAGELAQRLHQAHQAGDTETLQRYRALGQRLQRHIQLGGTA